MILAGQSIPDEAPVYVDPLMACLKSQRWQYDRACHLFVDTRTDIDVLHEFASRIGLKRGWFQNRGHLPHYDLNKSKRGQAVRLGAIQLDRHSAVMVFRRWRDFSFHGAHP
jgi:hypothetical protein